MANMVLRCLVHFLLPVVWGHGIFYSPTSRAQLSQLSGYESDATSIIAEPMPEVMPGRPYPGGRPWAEPGASKSNIGPCGMETYDVKKTNWNKPDLLHGWGDVQATYIAGQVIDVKWCVSDLADHGGIYSYRLCHDDPDLVKKFTNPAYTPNASEMAAMEECFQRGILPCTGVAGQECLVHPDCQEGWGCQNATAWFNCGPKDGGRCKAKGSGETCFTHGGPGTVLKDQVRLPDGYRSNHTLLGFRWDCQDTPQLWLHCADIKIQ